MKRIIDFRVGLFYIVLFNIGALSAVLVLNHPIIRVVELFTYELAVFAIIFFLTGKKIKEDKILTGTVKEVKNETTN